MDPQQARVSPEVEKSRYDEHRNTESPGYRQFFESLRESLRVHTKTEERGLDYGCGPTGYLADLIEKEDGRQIQKYDPYYFPDSSVLVANSYDFIVCTEVVEHFYEPRQELFKMWELLKENGICFLMTSPPPENFAEFAGWSYRRDTTHVGFFNEQVFKYLQTQMPLKLLSHQKNFWLLQKSSSN
ncbi:MAG: methyltransferase domain-containing protein [Bdellovibrionia bacterium]